MALGHLRPVERAWPDRSRRPSTDQFLLPALSLALIVLALGLAGVLIRNLVKLIVDRKRGILGSKLRTKLVFFFLALVLLPAVVLFYGSAQVIKQTVEAILRTPLEHLTQGREIVDEWMELLPDPRLAAGPRRWPRTSPRPVGCRQDRRRSRWLDLLERRRATEGLERIWILDRGTAVVRVGEDAGRAECDAPLDARASTNWPSRCCASGGRRRASTGSGRGRCRGADAGAPRRRRRHGRARAGPAGPGAIAGNAHEVIDAADQAYRQFRATAASWSGST